MHERYGADIVSAVRYFLALFFFEETDDLVLQIGGFPVVSTTLILSDADAIKASALFLPTEISY